MDVSEEEGRDVIEEEGGDVFEEGGYATGHKVDSTMKIVILRRMLIKT